MKSGPASSPVGRLLKLGGLVGRVGASLGVEQLLSLLRSGPSRQAHQLENLVRNADRIVHALGQLKGGAMKVGQMLSLQDSLLPPEVAEVLRTLQKEAPPIPFAAVTRQLDEQLPGWKRIFRSLEPDAIAAASIGQVHRGVLKDGRTVAVKVQYPGIDRIIEADLVNLRRVLKSLFSLLTDADFGPVWLELRDRLREELDYRHEAENLRRMALFYAGSDEVVIPGVVDETTTRSILTMEYVPGLGPDEACGGRTSQTQRDRWGLVLFNFLLRGLFEHRLLHADPNLSNFAFLPDGRIVVYDFGCVKSVPRAIAAGYRDLSRAALEGRRADVPPILERMGVGSATAGPLSEELIAPILEFVLEILEEGVPYRFGGDDQVFHRFLESSTSRFGEMKSVRFPHHIVFINRTIVGHFGNLNRLRAAAPWRRLLENRLQQAAT